MEYCRHVLAGAPNYCLDILDKLEKQVFMTVNLTLAASLEPLAHRRNVTSVFYRHYFGRSSGNWLN